VKRDSEEGMWCPAINRFIRGVIKKFSAWHGSVQNKIKVAFACTCTIWLLGYKCFVHFSGHRLFAYDMEKSGVMQCSEMTVLTDSFVTLHALLFWLRIEVVDPRFILNNNELWNKFLLGHIGIVCEVRQKHVHSSGVSILDTIWQTLCSYADMHKIYL